MPWPRAGQTRLTPATASSEPAAAGGFFAVSPTQAVLESAINDVASLLMDPEVTKSDDEWQAELTPQQYEVLRRKGTEPPFSGEYVHSKADGMYHCAACGAELFSSETKFDSGTGWPSFTEPAVAANVLLTEDRTHGMRRTEVTCAKCGSHLGHVFPDGPGETGMRYCINSLSLDLATGGDGPP